MEFCFERILGIAEFHLERKTSADLFNANAISFRDKWHDLLGPNGSMNICRAHFSDK